MVLVWELRENKMASESASKLMQAKAHRRWSKRKHIEDGRWGKAIGERGEEIREHASKKYTKQAHLVS
jgi:hypothetical protein